MVYPANNIYAVWYNFLNVISHRYGKRAQENLRNLEISIGISSMLKLENFLLNIQLL